MLSRYVHIRSLQCVKITCKFTERFLRNQRVFVVVRFIWPHPVYGAQMSVRMYVHPYVRPSKKKVFPIPMKFGV